MYSVGQVLYFILAKKSQVYPMQVVEIITKKTLGGEEVSYVLQAGPEKETKIMFDQVDGEVFESTDMIRQTLIHRATLQVNKLIDTAMSKADVWYSSQRGQKIPQTIHDLPELLSKNQQQKSEVDEDDSTVVLPDGSVVRVKLPKM